MPGFAFSIPIVQGKEELDRRTFDEMLGARREEYEAALRKAAITRQAIWHQETPDGTVAVVYVEGDNPEAGIAQFGSSDEPLNTWFREQMKEVHGVDISQVELRATKVHDMRLEDANDRGWVKVKNPNYWRRDAEREAMTRKHERRARTRA